MYGLNYNRVQLKNLEESLISPQEWMRDQYLAWTHWSIFFIWYVFENLLIPLLVQKGVILPCL